MKTKLLFSVLTALLVSLSTPVLAVEIDITDDPNKDFFIGYSMKYPPSDCEVIWFASQWETEYIMGMGNCDSVSNERAYKDLMKTMESVKSKSKATNFAEFQREIKSKTKKNRLRCLDTHSGTYIFLPAEAHNRPGWFYLDKLHNGGRLDTSIAGYWREAKNGNLIADFGINTVNVNMANVYEC